MLTTNVLSNFELTSVGDKFHIVGKLFFLILKSQASKSPQYKLIFCWFRIHYKWFLACNSLYLIERTNIDLERITKSPYEKNWDKLEGEAECCLHASSVHNMCNRE